MVQGMTEGMTEDMTEGSPPSQAAHGRRMGDEPWAGKPTGYGEAGYHRQGRLAQASQAVCVRLAAGQG